MDLEIKVDDELNKAFDLEMAKKAADLRLLGNSAVEMVLGELEQAEHQYMRRRAQAESAAERNEFETLLYLTKEAFHKRNVLRGLVVDMWLRMMGN
jgi:hypothetical protein